MRSRHYLQHFRTFFAATVFTAAAIVVFGDPALAQKGGGKGHGKHGGGPPGHQKQMGGGKQWGGGQGHGQQWKGQVQQQPGVWNVQPRRNHVIRQQQHVWKAQRQHQVDAWNARQQQQINKWNARRQQQQWSNWNAIRREKAWNPRRGGNGHGRGGGRKNRQISPAQVFSGNVWTGRQWGQWNAARNRYRRDLKHAWKDERKAQRRFEKEQRRFARVRSRDYNFNNYGNTYFYNDYDDERTSWKEHLLRTVIAGFLDRDRFNRRSYHTYSDFDYARYEQPVYVDSEPRYYNSPIFVDYSPEYAYKPEYDYGAFDDGDRSNLGGLLGQLPINELLSSFIGDGFMSELLGNLLVQGYDEGYLAGQAARENGYGDRYYDNPYVFEGGFCDPYSVSIGDNRELLSGGYELGFEDALNGRDDYDPYSDGNPDLVSALLSGVLGRV